MSCPRVRLYKSVKDIQWPIVYSPEYNISFLGMEKLHPFDAGKWGHIYDFLKEAGMIYDETTVRAEEASKEDLLLVHTEGYINSLKWSAKVAGITEVPPVALLPNFIVQRKVLKPFRFQTGGTILAARLAIERGWAINLGGGFHHCSSTKGGGFCAYADITLAIRYAMLGGEEPQATQQKHTGEKGNKKTDLDETDEARTTVDISEAEHTVNPSKEAKEATLQEPGSSSPPQAGTVLSSAAPPSPQRSLSPIRRAMIVDLDAHQGNGHERDFMGDENVYILDVYNREIYPHDGFAKRAIRRKVELLCYTEDEQYLRLVRTHLEGALNEFTPELIVYNAGTDILEGDPLGALSISPQGIIERDQIVFEKARERNIPIVMVTSGGYQKTTARIIADSILNLQQHGLIQCEAAQNYKPPQALIPPSTSTLPRTRSEGGIWAKFKSCANMSRASTPEAQRSTQPSPLGMPRSQTIDSRISQSRTPTAAAVIESGSQLQGSGSSIGIARSRTQEDFRKIDENFDEDFFEEQIDFRSMLEVGMKKREKREEREEGKKTKTKEEGMKEQDEIETAKEVTDDYDSSPYDSDASDGIIDPDNPLYKIECPSYEDFIQSTMNIEVKVTNVEGETVIPEENPIT